MANRPQVVLVGDTIVDITTTGRAIGLSAETPTITVQAEHTAETAGGAAYVSRNLDALGCAHTFLSNHTVDGKPPVSKHRFWDGNYKLFQVNTGSSEPMADDQAQALLDQYTPRQNGILVISDYRHGLLTEALVRGLIRKAHAVCCDVFVDIQVSKQSSNHDWYKRADVMFVNQTELRYVPHWFDDHGTVVVKMGKDGARMYGRMGIRHVVGHPVDAVDTCGAGDAFLAAFVAAVASQDQDPLSRANAWAAAKCTITGMGVPNANAQT